MHFASFRAGNCVNNPGFNLGIKVLYLQTLYSDRYDPLISGLCSCIKLLCYQVNVA